MRLIIASTGTALLLSAFAAANEPTLAPSQLLNQSMSNQAAVKQVVTTQVAPQATANQATANQSMPANSQLQWRSARPALAQSSRSEIGQIRPVAHQENVARQETTQDNFAGPQLLNTTNHHSTTNQLSTHQLSTTEVQPQYSVIARTDSPSKLRIAQEPQEIQQAVQLGDNPYGGNTSPLNRPDNSSIMTPPSEPRLPATGEPSRLPQGSSGIGSSGSGGQGGSDSILDRPSLSAPNDLPLPDASRSARPDQDGGRTKNIMTEDCEAGKRALSAPRLSATMSQRIVNLRPTSTGDMPFECQISGGSFNERSWNCLTYTWKASALCHKPLYFEQVNMERYGHSWGPFLDPVVSSAHFFVGIPLWPYKMGMDPLCECQYPLGYYRPGNCAPYMMEPIPISPRGIAAETGFVLGAIYTIP